MVWPPLRAIPAGSLPLGETSRLVRFLTPRGKVPAVVRDSGRRRARRRLQALSEVELVVVPGRGERLARVREWSEVEGYQRLRHDPRGLGEGSYVVELSEVLMQEGDPSPGLYGLTRETLRAMNEVAAPRRWAETARVYELLALAEAGFLPRLDRCGACGREVGGRAFFDAAAGGLLCPRPDCSRGSEVLSLDPPTLASMRGALRTGVRSLRTLRLDRATLVTWQGALASFIDYHVDRPLRSQRYLDQLHIDSPT